MEYEVAEYLPVQALLQWCLVAGVITAVALLLALLASFLRWGPSGSAVFARGLRSYLRDLVTISPVRILAVSRLTLKEAVRRKALMVFVFFAVLLMFGGWFMSGGESRESIAVSVQVWFLLTAISWLVLPAVMFLACWSIPEEIRVRSLHTVVTKPIRRVEIVLGRMIGFGVVVTAVVLIMGMVGLVWIERQVGGTDESGQPRLTCRVPVYGILYFKDRQGNLASEGVNTGDVWAYRSYIEGNSRARAVWRFPDVREEMLQTVPGKDGPGLKLESRFEVFRTVKGSAESIEKGVEAQVVLIRDLRERAFALFGLSSAFRNFGEELQNGEFRNAAASLTEICDAIDEGSALMQSSDFFAFVNGAKSAIGMFRILGDEFRPFQEAFQKAGNAAAAVRSGTDQPALEHFAREARPLIALLEENSDLLMEHLPRLEVSLPPFRVNEYHEGADELFIPRRLEYAADYESLARYLTVTVRGWNDSGRLVKDGKLVSGLASALADSTDISLLNAELLVQVLQEDLDAGELTVSDDQIRPADDRSWLSYFDSMIRSERLVSPDPRGWVLTADLFDDLLYRGELTAEVACLERDMFLGMAKPDLFIRMKDAPFFVGYSKALVTTILSLLLVVIIGVTAGCIVKGPVALFLTFGVFLIGQVFHQFMIDLLAGNISSGGMVTSSVLLIQQRAPEVGVDASASAVSMIEALDRVGFGLLFGASRIIPDFSLFARSAAYVESGFDVPWNSLLLPSIQTFVGFFIPCVLLAAAFLKFRELEAK